jgi:uncharacterized protein (TIGR02001 family)
VCSSLRLKPPTWQAGAHTSYADILIFKSAPASAAAKTANPASHRLDVSLDVAVVSDYRRAGVSRSGGGAAVQDTIHLNFPHGWNAGVFTSTTDRQHSNFDVALFGAKKFQFGDTDLVLGATAAMNVDRGGVDFGIAQASLAHPVGPFDFTLSVSYAWRQPSLDDEDNLYVSVRGKSRIGRLLGVPVTLGISVGRTEGHFAAEGPRLDWSTSLTADLRGTDFGISYVDNDLSGDRGNPALIVSVAHTF